MQTRRRWLVPVGLAIIGLVVAATAGGSVGLGRSDRPLMSAIGLAVYVAAGVSFLLWDAAPRPVVIALLLVLATAATLVHHADPNGPVVGLYLATAFAPLRLELRSAIVVAAVGVAIFDAGLLIDAPNAPVFILVVTGGAAFFFLLGALLRSEEEQRIRADHLVEELETSREAEKAAAAVAERARLAREMHDVLAHTLTGLVVQLDGARLLARSREDDELAEIVQRAHGLARDGLAEARQAISALRGDELPGPALLDRLVTDTSEATGIHAELAVTGDPRPLAPEVGLALYRTAQEALINTAKYAGHGGRAELSLTYRPGGIELAIEDARAPDAAPPSAGGLTFGGYGLTGMRERAELLGGRLTAGPTDHGFQVLLWLPTGPAAHPVAHEAEAG